MPKMKNTLYAAAVPAIILLTVFSQTACPSSVSEIWYGRPVGFKYYISKGEGTARTSKSSSTVVRGTIAGDKTEISFGSQERIGGKVLSEINWAGSIEGRLHGEIVRVVGAADLEDLPKQAPLRSGGGWNVFEVTLVYEGGKERRGLPASPQEFHEIIEKIEEIARADAAKNNQLPKPVFGDFMLFVSSRPVNSRRSIAE
jgi:hypothetical protein